MIEVSFSKRDPFAPAITKRGFIGELRDRLSPMDLMECGWEAGQFSTDRENISKFVEDANAEGWEARLLPGIATQAHAGAQFELHRLH